MRVKLAEDIYWVGHVDWDVRDFHGYNTSRGSTYNAYLILDQKTALIDSVKARFVDQLLSSLREVLGERTLDYVVCNHAEPDHSGGLVEVMRAFPGAELVCNAKCRDALQLHYDTSSWRFMIVADGDELSIGVRSLTFVETPMVHWPESMFTYVKQDSLLFSMDAFGQHLASAGRFDDEQDFQVIMEEAKTYYANIVMLYGKPITRVLDKSTGLDIKMIAPSHGVIWRSRIADIVAAYRDWVVCRPQAKVLLVYDTMWGSTAKMAEAIAEGAAQAGAKVKMISIRDSHITEVATEALDAAVYAFGSATLNMSLMPQMAAALTYLRGLRPTGKMGWAFGSYGWGKGGAEEVNRYLTEMNCRILGEPIRSRFKPDGEVLEKCREAGEIMAAEAIRAESTGGD